MPSRARPKPKCAKRWPATSAAAERMAGSSRRCCAPRMKPGGRDMNISLTRRSFAKGLGASVGGIVIAFTLDPEALRAQPARLPGGLAGNNRGDAWLRINRDGSATVFTGKVELG